MTIAPGIETVLIPDLWDEDGDEDGLVHIVCLCQVFSFCGLDMRDCPEAVDWAENQECIVCVEMEKENPTYCANGGKCG